jgi:hypothetical protein
MTNGGDRRLVPRKPAHLVAEIELDGTTLGCGVSRDASATGLLLLTHTDVPPGTKVVLKLWVPNEPAPRMLRALVVRRERLLSDQSPIWSHQVAVSLDEPPPDLERIADALAKR